MTEVTIYTDGSCSGNPGPGGWAAILMHGEHVRELTGHERETTNNRMELRAIVEALTALKKRCVALVHTDSAYVVNAFNEGWINNWQRRGWKTAAKKPVKNKDLWLLLLAQMDEHDVKFIKVKGHADNPLNNRADELAVAAMEAGRWG